MSRDQEFEKIMETLFEMSRYITVYELSLIHIFGYEFVRLGKMMEDIRHGKDPKEAYEKNVGTYGRFANAAKYIDPREE